ncbi:MAG: DUF1127 domain-containing protein [Aestuariivirga sp.]
MSHKLTLTQRVWPNVRVFAFAVSAVSRLVRTITAALERARVRASLRQLDDHILKDMGISRSEIDWIVSERRDAIAQEREYSCWANRENP